MPWVLALALLKAGNSMPAKMAMIAITTSSSINVNALVGAFRRIRFHGCMVNDGCCLLFGLSDPGSGSRPMLSERL